MNDFGECLERSFFERDVTNRAQWADFLDKKTLPTYLGCLLALLPNLIDLKMNIEGPGGVPIKNARKTVFNGFIECLPNTGSCQQLRDLTIPYGYLRELSGQLPNLKALRLSHVEIEDVLEDVSTNVTLPHWKLKYFKVRLDSYGISFPEVTNALQWLSKSLGSLDIETLAIAWTEDDRSFPLFEFKTDYDALFNLVIACWPGVNRLEVIPALFKSVAPSTSSVHSVTGLHDLSVPFAVLVDREFLAIDFQLSDWSERALSSIARTFPKELKTLTIQEADKNIVPWLECFFDLDDQLPDLISIGVIRRISARSEIKDTDIERLQKMFEERKICLTID
ncbi:hypothetical protein K491DRAFT_721162 [Lophiostoma macrostomum CBS 122681]|uniref:F-box domain-containing protein n=1 Tax=Lophiostoma macrostomum CBS 122681 TaxID=1314788 RepID=A0A6A6STQ1_9PLEO|nr:hypothetical protein K491DRAFT_721162 [Lophiostoma macrostomum CBS 122681]